MKIGLSEKQIKRLFVIKEQLNIDKEEDDNKIVKEFRNMYQWFDYMPSDLKTFFERTKNTMHSFDNVMMATMEFLNSRYDLKRVTVKDNGNVVGFLIYSYTTPEFEDIEQDMEDKLDDYPVLLATAVHPQYRQKGLLKMMISNAPITKPFLVQTSQISQPEVWNKMGCKLVQDLSSKYGPGNQIELCN